MLGAMMLGQCYFTGEDHTVALSASMEVCDVNICMFFRWKCEACFVLTWLMSAALDVISEPPLGHGGSLVLGILEV